MQDIDDELLGRRDYGLVNLFDENFVFLFADSLICLGIGIPITIYAINHADDPCNFDADSLLFYYGLLFMMMLPIIIVAKCARRSSWMFIYAYLFGLSVLSVYSIYVLVFFDSSSTDDSPFSFSPSSCSSTSAGLFDRLIFCILFAILALLAIFIFYFQVVYERFITLPSPNCMFWNSLLGLWLIYESVRQSRSMSHAHLFVECPASVLQVLLLFGILPLTAIVLLTVWNACNMFVWPKYVLIGFLHYSRSSIVFGTVLYVLWSACSLFSVIRATQVWTVTHDNCDPLVYTWIQILTICGWMLMMMVSCGFCCSLSSIVRYWNDADDGFTAPHDYYPASHLNHHHHHRASATLPHSDPYMAHHDYSYESFSTNVNPYLPR